MPTSRLSPYFFCLSFIGTLSPWGQAESITFPAASPAATITQRIGLTDFELNYSRPSVKGRQIFGGLQAYGELWRTGANAATTLSFDTDIRFGGQAVPAGTYALFTVPGQETWTIILNNQAEQWGGFRYDPADDVVRVEVPSQTDAPMRETLHLGFNALQDETAVLEIAWENTVVEVPIAVDVRNRLQPRIEAALSSGKAQNARIYFQAAAFYYDHQIDLERAAEWIDLALKQRPQAYWMLHMKAKIHAALGNGEVARAAALASTEYAVAQEGPHSGYKVMNDTLISRLP
jgi:hypothetical protein